MDSEFKYGDIVDQVVKDGLKNGLVLYVNNGLVKVRWTNWAPQNETSEFPEDIKRHENRENLSN